jgi:hypothetical protein
LPRGDREGRYAAKIRTEIKAMGLLDFPNPTEWITGVKDDEQKRQLINSAASAMYSAWITFTWKSGSSKVAQWFGEGQALQDSATAMYLSLRELERKQFLTLTVPQDLLSADNLSRFQTEEKIK